MNPLSPGLLRAGAGLLITFLTTLPVMATEPTAIETVARRQIEILLERQAKDWNRGDMVAFTSVYSDDVTFISPSGMTQGRQQVLERYQKRYPDAAARGTLSFEVLELRVADIGAHCGKPTVDDGWPEARLATMVARWHLAYDDKDDATGLTLLVFHPTADGSWQIVQDASM